MTQSAAVAADERRKIAAKFMLVPTMEDLLKGIREQPARLLLLSGEQMDALRDYVRRRDIWQEMGGFKI